MESSEDVKRLIEIDPETLTVRTVTGLTSPSLVKSYSLAFSPDGKTLAYIARNEGKFQVALFDLVGLKTAAPDPEIHRADCAVRAAPRGLPRGAVLRSRSTPTRRDGPFERVAKGHPILKNVHWSMSGDLLDNGAIETERLIKNLEGFAGQDVDGFVLEHMNARPAGKGGHG